MPSTDIDGSAMLILGPKDAKLILDFLKHPGGFFVMTPGWERIRERAQDVVDFEEKRDKSIKSWTQL